jgi:predicted RNA-binding protein YlxR (DUF448 family)
MKPKRELVRVVKTPEGNVMLDRSGKANGRGAYICHSTECYKKAVKAKRLERAFSMAIPTGVSEQIVKELEADEQ